MPVCQEAAILGEVSYHQYTGLATSTDERDALAQSLGVINKVSKRKLGVEGTRVLLISQKNTIK